MDPSVLWVLLKPPHTPVTALPATIEVYEAHGTKWYDHPIGISHAINVADYFNEWGVWLPAGEIWREGDNADESRTGLRVFLQNYSKDQLQDTFVLTRMKLRQTKSGETTKYSLLKSFW
jgi:hypothetical protein